MIEIIVLVAGFFVAWNIGANNAANCVGVSIGGQVLSFRRAISIVIVFVILGALLEGWKNMRTVGEGIILPGQVGVNPLSAVPLVAVASLIAVGLWMFISTWRGIPMSVSLSTVGSVIGAGVLITVMRPELGVVIQYERLGLIAFSWVLNPMIAASMAFVVFKAVSMSLRRIKNVVLFDRVLRGMILVASAYSAYVLGANDVGASAGVIFAFFGGSSQIIAVFGAVALAVGAVTFSRRVILTVGSGIVSVDPILAFAAQFGAALTVWSFVQFGIPVSTSEAIIGGIAGAGLLKGASTVSRRKLVQISVALILAPIVALVFSFGIGWLLLGLS